MFKRLIQLSLVLALFASTSGCGMVRRCVCCPLHRWQSSVQSRTWCGKGCGETYCSEWHNDPPCCKDPCCNCGHYCGPHHMGPLPMHNHRMMPGGDEMYEGDTMMEGSGEPTPAPTPIPTPAPMSRRGQPRRTASIEGMRLGEERVISEQWTDGLAEPETDEADARVADRRK